MLAIRHESTDHRARSQFRTLVLHAAIECFRAIEHWKEIQQSISILWIPQAWCEFHKLSDAMMHGTLLIETCCWKFCLRVVFAYFAYPSFVAALLAIFCPTVTFARSRFSLNLALSSSGIKSMMCAFERETLLLYDFRRRTVVCYQLHTDAGFFIINYASALLSWKRVFQPNAALQICVGAVMTRLQIWNPNLMSHFYCANTSLLLIISAANTMPPLHSRFKIDF